MKSKGSVWRKWDLQVGTNIYTRYKGVNLEGTKLVELCELSGLSRNQINSDHKKLSDEDYAKLFVEHFVHYNEMDVIALANHNSGRGIQEILKYLNLQKKSKPNSKYTEKFIFPGIEIGGNDKCHVIIVFNPNTKIDKKYKFDSQGKKTEEYSWGEYIDKFLDDIDIKAPRFYHNQPSNSSSMGVKEIISKSQEWDFVSVFPHITNKDGIWKELQNSNRKELYIDDNFGIVDIPLTSTDQDLKNICAGKHTSWGDKALAVINSSDAETILKIGSLYSYIKGDPTIKGLKHLFIEPKDRVITGSEPEIFDRVRLNRTKYLKQIKIKQIKDYSEQYGTWFKDIEIPLNSELVTIIGNKGNGKSALADIIALCANYKNQDDFSFLNDKKFRDGIHAQNFEGTIIWESDDKQSRNLADKSDNGELELVKYLPQGYFERLTNNSESTEEFQREIENVIFTHLDKDEKIGFATFQELIDSKKEIINKEINRLKNHLKPLNKEILGKEKKLKPKYKSNLKAKVEQKLNELKALKKPEKVANPNKDSNLSKKNKERNAKLINLQSELENLESKAQNKNIKKQKLTKEVNEIKQIKKNIEAQKENLKDFITKNRGLLDTYEINIGDVIKYNFDYSTIDKTIALKKSTITSIEKEIGIIKSTDPKFKSLLDDITIKKNEINNIEKGLGIIEKTFQKYLANLRAWEDKKGDIIGSKDTPDSLEYWKNELKYVDSKLKHDLKSLKNKRMDISEEIFSKMKSILDIYMSVKSKIDQIITKNKDLLDTYKINIDASFGIKINFINDFLNFISLNKIGTFYGRENANKQLHALSKNSEVDNFINVKCFLNDIIHALSKDLRKDEDKHTFIDEQVTDVEGLYNYLFSLDFLEYNYELKQGGKNLKQLSPGEKGALLLIFYLLLDNNDTPLIIDQPEDNLDNDSVANVLVPFIKRAKKSRQIIMVTHNPNLAVVADAEQVIHVELDKENNNKFSFKSGSIEDPEINNCIVKVLEGAMPAFNKRKRKYFEN